MSGIKTRHVSSLTGVGDWPQRVATVDNINLKSVAGTLIWSGPVVGKVFIPTMFIVRCTSDTSITVGAFSGVGKTNGVNDLWAADSMAGVLATDDAWVFPGLGATKLVQAGDEVWFNVTVAATGTAQVASVDLIGMLI